MATIHFKLARAIPEDYWSPRKVTRAHKDENLSGLTLLIQEYQIVCGDIGSDTRTRRENLENLRKEMEQDGHTIILGNQP
jgi:hypothetical protein